MVDHREVNHSSGAVGVGFVVAGQAAVVHQPAQRSLDVPPPRQDGESSGSGVAADAASRDRTGVGRGSRRAARRVGGRCTGRHIRSPVRHGLRVTRPPLASGYEALDNLADLPHGHSGDVGAGLQTDRVSTAVQDVRPVSRGQNQAPSGVKPGLAAQAHGVLQAAGPAQPGVLACPGAVASCLGTSRRNPRPLLVRDDDLSAEHWTSAVSKQIHQVRWPLRPLYGLI